MYTILQVTQMVVEKLLAVTYLAQSLLMLVLG
jgi:hypothetical protein